MVRLINASISQPPPPPRVEGWEWGVARCETVTASSWCTGLGVLRHSFLPNEPKNKIAMRIQIMINVAYQSLLPSLWSTSSWSLEKPCNNCSPERHLASLLSLQFQAQNDTRRAAAGPGPCAPVRGWGVHDCSAARYLDFLLQIAFWNFSV